MKAFCAWMHVDTGGVAPEAAAQDMLGQAGDGAGITCRSGPGWLLALGGGPGAGAIVEADGAVVLVNGNARAAASAAEPAAVVASCMAADTRGEVPLAGHYSVVGIDPERAGLLAVVDRFASHPVYYARVGDGIVLGSTPAIVAAHPAVDAALHEQAIYEYMYASVVPAPLTIFRAVQALPSGGGLRLRERACEAFANWVPEFVDPRSARAGPEQEREVLALLNEAVSRSIDGAGATGCFLSGGIDSSTMTGCLGAVTGESPQTFSIGFDATGYDEMDFARTAASHFGAVPHEYYVTPEDILAVIPIVSKVFGQPFGNASVVPAYRCAVLAREHGITSLLAGDGGDELFGGNERYGRNWLYTHFEGLPAPVRNTLAAWSMAESPVLGGLPGVRKVVSYVRQARLPLPGRMDVYNYVNRLGAERIFAPDFLAGVDPQRIVLARAARFRDARAADDVDRMLALDYQITLADNDLRKVTGMCDAAGMDVRYPFLEDEIVDFSLTLPAVDKVQRTHLRHFFKKAMGGFLPDKVINKTKHGFGLPFGPWAVSHDGLKGWVAATLASAADRGIINAGLIRDLQTGLLAEHPGYYGPLVWQIAILESWLQENRR